MSTNTKQFEPEWTEVESSNIHSVRYDEANQDLYVRFQSGSTYKYAKVDSVVYSGLIYADSVGKFLNSQIKPFHAYELVSV